MDVEYWVKRWENGETGFHLPRIHPKLTQYWASMNPDKLQRVLVPLCGKTQDLLFLAEQSKQVIGIEASELAARAFFIENSLVVSEERTLKGLQLSSANIIILVADFFALNAQDVGDIDVIYDRAALIALPSELRSKYANQLKQWMSPKTRQLLITLHYQQSEMAGPPFSVDMQELAQLYAGYSIERFCEHEIIELEPRFKDKGLSSLKECVYLIHSIESTRTA